MPISSSPTINLTLPPTFLLFACNFYFHHTRVQPRLCTAGSPNPVHTSHTSEPPSCCPSAFPRLCNKENTLQRRNLYGRNLVPGLCEGGRTPAEMTPHRPGSRAGDGDEGWEDGEKGWEDGEKGWEDGDKGLGKGGQGLGGWGQSLGRMGTRLERVRTKV